MRLPESRLHLVADPADRPEHARFIQTLDAPARAVCEIRADGRGTLAWLAGTMLQALGKTAKRAGHGRDAQLAWRRAIVWSESQQIEQLIVTRAQLLTPSDIEALLDLACLCDCELWLIAQGKRLPRLTGETLAMLPLKQWSWPQFRRHWRGHAASAPRRKPAQNPKARYQHLPDDEFATFLASTEELLPVKEAGRVEQDFYQAFEETDRWLAQQDEIGNEDAAPFLLRLLGSRRYRPEMVVALRGAQAAFFDHRYLLKADLDRLLARRRQGFGPNRAAELGAAANTYASTTHAAASALSLIFHDPQLQVAASLNVADVAEDGSIVTAEGADVDVPAPLRPLLRAQRLARILEGAQEGAPLFLSENKRNGGKPIWERTTARGLQRLVRDLGRETGLPLIVCYSTSRQSAERKWVFDLGLSVQKLRIVRNVG